MSFRGLVTVAAAGLLAAACASDPDSGAATSGVSQAPSTRTVQGDSTVSTAAQAPRPGSQEELNAKIGDRVFFAFDSSDLSPQARDTVERWASWLNQYNSVSATVEGHTDERGTREYNLALGERRAEAVKSYLTTLGVAPRRVETISYGKERPAVAASNPEAWARNRRAVMVVN